MSGASVSCVTVGQYYDSHCVDCDWFETEVGTSTALGHAMDAGHNVTVHFITVSRAEAHNGRETDTGEQRSGGAAADGKA